MTANSHLRKTLTLFSSRRRRTPARRSRYTDGNRLLTFLLLIFLLFNGVLCFASRLFRRFRRFLLHQRRSTLGLFSHRLHLGGGHLHLGLHRSRYLSRHLDRCLGCRLGLFKDKYTGSSPENATVV